MKNSQSLRGKFMRTLLLVMGSTGLATLVIVVVTSAQASSHHLDSVQRYIEQGITSKGRVLTENHARALRGLTLDNAFLDMQRLVERVVQEDSELVYGLYVNSNRETLASSHRGVPALPDKPPAKDAWRILQIPEEDLLVLRESVKRTTRLGEELLEVAMPVTSEDAEFLGTVRYGVSTRPMRDAIAHARADANARLRRSVLWLAAFVTLFMVLGLWLSRIQAVRITRPVADLTVAAEALATGNRTVRVGIDSGDEIGMLGASFNRMVHDLDASYRELETLNRVLEQKVEERTLQLGRKNRDMQLVMDNVGQGFITLDIEGTMSAERSRVIDAWFGQAEGSPKFWDYLGRIDASVGEWFDLGWASLRDDVLPLSLSLEQLPAVVRKDDRTFELAYRPIMEGERLDKVIVVITDVTARIERERAEQAQREMMSIFRRTLSDKMALDGFFVETGTLVDAITLSEASDLTLLRRHVHTLKGNTALFGIESVAAFCDRLEDGLNESAQAISDGDKKMLRTMWAKIKQMRAQLIDDASTGRVELDRQEYDAFVEDLRRGPATDLLVARVASWQFEPATKRLALLGEQVRGLAKRLGKASVEVVCQPTSLRLPPLKWGAFWSAFAHVVRNTVDHGVETADERMMAGKPPQATVVLSVARETEHVVVTIADDGPGIDWIKIAARAERNNLPHATRADLEQALFVDGISSRADVTSTSGRGIGLSAVRDVVRELGGVVQIRNDPGRGTAFRFVLPLVMLFEDLSVDDPGSHGMGTSAPHVAAN